MNWLTLVTTLSCTLPSHNVLIPGNRLQPPTCAESTMPCSDLSRLIIHGAPQVPSAWWFQDPGPEYGQRVIADLDVIGREGQPIQYLFDDQGLVWTVWVTTKDLSGNESCRSNQIGVNLGPGIPDPSAPPPERP